MIIRKFIAGTLFVYIRGFTQNCDSRQAEKYCAAMPDSLLSNNNPLINKLYSYPLGSKNLSDYMVSPVNKGILLDNNSCISGGIPGISTYGNNSFHQGGGTYSPMDISNFSLGGTSGSCTPLGISNMLNKSIPKNIKGAGMLENCIPINGVNPQISPLSQGISGNCNQINRVGPQISPLPQRISGGFNQISGVGPQISPLSQGISGNCNQVTGVGPQISPLSQGISGNCNQISGVGPQISPLSQGISGNCNQVTGTNQNMGISNFNTVPSYIPQGINQSNNNIPQVMTRTPETCIQQPNNYTSLLSQTSQGNANISPMHTQPINNKVFANICNVSDSDRDFENCVENQVKKISNLIMNCRKVLGKKNKACCARNKCLRDMSYDRKSNYQELSKYGNNSQSGDSRIENQNYNSGSNVNVPDGIIIVDEQSRLYQYLKNLLEKTGNYKAINKRVNSDSNKNRRDKGSRDDSSDRNTYKKGINRRRGNEDSSTDDNRKKRRSSSRKKDTFEEKKNMKRKKYDSDSSSSDSSGDMSSETQNIFQNGRRGRTNRRNESDSSDENNDRRYKSTEKKCKEKAKREIEKLKKKKAKDCKT